MAKKRFKILAAKGGGYYWHLEAKNNKIVCSSQVYKTKEACIRGAAWVREKAASTEILDYTSESA